MTGKEPPTGIAKSVQAKARAGEVFRQVSTAEGIRNWWCKNVSGSDATGGELVLKFPGGHMATVSLAKTTKPSRVEWAVKDHNELKEWIGTRIGFEIRPRGGNRSEVLFFHNLAPGCGCYEACDGAWSFLMNSLKVQLESGKGTPV
jgi:uncharacterized protein YndB with AHSA1/START domain